MAVKSKREKNKELTENEIIDAAERLFFSKGYENTTMTEVAKEADFSKRTIYVYFDSKKQLYLAIVLRGFKKLIELTNKGFKEIVSATGLEKVETMGRSFIELYQRYPNYFEAVVNYETQKEDLEAKDRVTIQCYEEGEKIFKLLLQVVKEGIKDGSIRSDIDVIDTAIALWANIVGINTLIAKKKRYIEGYHNKNVKEIVTANFDFIKRSIKKK
ncbi:hypothetical protein U472_11040 [Orenia metallireducens]|uniref:HTH tetR-type domain-containing protein n=1 Tax=Orenia metallireducens TaxID=1413210 RepID=A0A1C0A8G7_9FIRM|nr:TetR/AcrR family transcriptional regulator [Orenia metallireducens]OCL26522.1 hypothetical protein U472_11040 [Orenia metallireducens]